MAVRVVFRCESCDAVPDAATHGALEGQLLDGTTGAYLDAQPGGWLIWTAGGALGTRRYACPEHRDALTADVRKHYGAHTAARQSEPYTSVWPDGLRGFDEQGLAALLAAA